MHQGHDGGSARTDPRPHHAPLRFVPPAAPAAGGVPLPSHPADAVQDHLADLFLGEDAVRTLAAAESTLKNALRDDPAPRLPALAGQFGAAAVASRVGPASIAAQPPTIEAVILGHLPVRAGVWVRGYAAAVAAEQQRPVGLLRLSAEGWWAEIVGPSPTPTRDAHAAAGTWHAALQRLRTLSHVIVTADALDEPDLAAAGAIDDLTILTAADDTSAVAVYGLLKGLAQAATPHSGPAQRPDDGEAAEPAHARATRIGVAVVAADPADASRCFGRVDRAARAFLGLPVLRRPAVPKLAAATARTLAWGEQRTPPAAAVAALAGHRPAPTPANAKDTPEPGVAPRGAHAPQKPGLNDAPSGLDGVQPGPIERLAPARASAVDASSADVSSSSGLADHRGPIAPLVAGLSPLVSRCPDHPSVEFAADAQGGLHLLVDLDASSANAASGIEPLLAAAAWARRHAALLTRCEPALRDSGSSPAVHAASRHADRLLPRLGSGVHLHLVVTTPTPQGPVHTTARLA